MLKQSEEKEVLPAPPKENVKPPVEDLYLC